MPVHPKGDTQGRVSSTCVRRDATDVHGTKQRLPNRLSDYKAASGFLIMCLLGLCSGLVRNACSRQLYEISLHAEII